MAHHITMRADGTAEMAYVEGSKTPWHHLGNIAPRKAPIAKWVELAGMDFDIVSRTPFIHSNDGEEIAITDRVVLCRSDNNRPLGFVSTGFKVVQPKEILHFFRDLIECLGLELETAGTLYGGKRYWALAKIGEKSILHGNDGIKGYLLLTTACDGSMATTAKLVSVCVVCANTLSFALHSKTEDGACVKVSHSQTFDPQFVKETLGVAPRSFGDFLRTIEKMSKKSMTKRMVNARAVQLFGETGHLVKHVNRLFDGEAMGFERPGFAGTAWGFLNCVTEAVDHHSRGKKSPSHDLDYMLYGAGDQAKTRAFEMALALID